MSAISICEPTCGQFLKQMFVCLLVYRHITTKLFVICPIIGVNWVCIYKQVSVG